jgi:hypothetical protein
MAIHKTVFYSPDRHIRVTADPSGNTFTVERDLVFVGKAGSLADLALLLAELGLTFEDLIEG